MSILLYFIFGGGHRYTFRKRGSNVGGQAECQKCEPFLMKTSIKTGRYKGPWDCLRSVFKQEGLRGCYRGLGIQGRIREIINVFII